MTPDRATPPSPFPNISHTFPSFVFALFCTVGLLRKAGLVATSDVLNVLAGLFHPCAEIIKEVMNTECDNAEQLAHLRSFVHSLFRKTGVPWERWVYSHLVFTLYFIYFCSCLTKSLFGFCNFPAMNSILSSYFVRWMMCATGYRCLLKFCQLPSPRWPWKFIVVHETYEPHNGDGIK